MGADAVAQLDRPKQCRRAATAELLERTASIAQDNAALGAQFSELLPPLPALAVRPPLAKPESIDWFRDTLAAPLTDGELARLGIRS